MRALFFSIFLTWTVLSPAHSATRVDACAKYLNTNKAYKVEVTLISGSELNSKTYTFDYDAFSTYAVIFWSNDQASVIELDFFLGSLNPFGTKGYDQEGRPWEISSNTTFCF